jgi:hypothetical protein
MRKFFTIVSLCVLSLQVFSQSEEWTKDDRKMVKDEYMDALTKYKNIKPEQKTSIALACIKLVTDKYPNKKDYKNLLDEELERIQEANIRTAASNLGISLDEAKVKEEPKNESNTFRVEDFSGIWTSDVGVYTFVANNGTYSCTSSTQRGCMNDRGDYHIEGRRLTIQSTRDLCNWSSGRYIIITVSSDEIVLSAINNNKEVHLKKIK